MYRYGSMNGYRSWGGNLEGEWSENLDSFSTMNVVKRSGDHPASIIWDMIETPVLLALIGSFSALLSYIVHFIIGHGNDFRRNLVGEWGDILPWILYCLYCTTMSLLACFFTHFICKASVGGGLPEMKTILSGVVKPVLLSKRLILAKFSGLSFALLAGLSVGREGPFIHISGAIADQLMRLPFFRHIRRQDARRLEILSCAFASGVSATFGNAFGGVLFSIEFTSTVYRVRTLPKAFFTSACAMLVLLFLGVSDKLALFQKRDFVLLALPMWHEVIGFIVFGVFCGLLGVAFVSLVEAISKFRNQLLDPLQNSKSTIRIRRYLIVGSVTLFVSFFMYYELATIPATGKGWSKLLDYLFQDRRLTLLVPKLAIYLFYKIIVTALSVTLPLPVGLFAPVFVIGGVLGRIVGEIIVTTTHVSSLSSNFEPWEYSLLGAAGFATGVTRAISTAIIVFELSGQSHLALPVSIVVITAHFVGNRFSRNIYDVLIHTNKTPFMQDLPKELFTVPIAHVMMPIQEEHVLSLKSTYGEVFSLLKATEPVNGRPWGRQRRDSDTGRAHDELFIEEENDSDSIDLNEDPESKETEENGLKPLGTSSKLEKPTYLVIHQRKIGQQESTVKRYNPSIIPVVQSKGNMVIVGAVLREDLKQALLKIKEICQVADATPVLLARYNDDGIELGSSPDPSTIKDSSRRRSSLYIREQTRLSFNLERDALRTQRSITPPLPHPKFMHSPIIHPKLTHPQLSHPPETQHFTRPYQQTTHLSRNNPVNQSQVVSDIQAPTGLNRAGTGLNSNELEEVLKAIQEADSLEKVGIPEFGGQYLVGSENSSNLSVTPDGSHEGTPLLIRHSIDQRKPFVQERVKSKLERDLEGINPKFLEDVVQYVLVASDGKQLIPVANSNYKNTDAHYSSLPVCVPLDSSPYQVVETMHLSKVDMLFRMLSLNQAYVTNSGRLVGLVTRASLREYLGHFVKVPIDRCKLLCYSIFNYWTIKRDRYETVDHTAGDL